MPKDTRLEKLTRARAVLDGLTKHFRPRKTYLLAGVLYTGEQIAAVYRAQVAALDAVDAARIALHQAVVEERRATRAAVGLIQPLKGRVANDFGVASAAFAAFGWKKPKKPGPKTVRAKAQMVEKARATRAARRGAPR